MQGRLGRYLSSLCVGCFQNPKRALGILLFTFLVAVVYGAFNLKLQLAWTYLFEKEDPIVREFERARELFPYPGDIAILVDQGTAEQRERYLDLVAREMKKEPERRMRCRRGTFLSRKLATVAYPSGTSARTCPAASRTRAVSSRSSASPSCPSACSPARAAPRAHYSFG